MSEGVDAGSVSALWRFPVKSMQGELLEQVELTEHGIAGDRAYALIDVESGKVVSAKSVKLFPDLFGCRADFVTFAPDSTELPPVRIALPNGKTVTSDSDDIDHALSEFFGRAVRLARTAPDDFTIDQYHPDVEDADPRGYRDTSVEQKLGTAFYAEIGMPSPVTVGSFFDLFPVSVLTTATLAKLSELRPESRFDERRFRMNVIVDVAGERFVENDWTGSQLAKGDSAQIRVAMPDPRCVMTTLAQGDLPRDNDILRTLARYNRLPIGGAGLFPCAGVYGVVESPGTLRTGDRVSLN